MRAAFGDGAPQPFALIPNGRRGESTVLGYSSAPKEYLLEQRQSLATPVLEAAFSYGGILGKEMPQAWRAGRSFGFEVRFCPVARLTTIKNGKRRARERDVFLAACDLQSKGGPPLNREPVYLDWLKTRLSREGAARVLDARMVSFHLVKPVRRGQHPGKAAYLGHKACGPMYWSGQAEGGGFGRFRQPGGPGHVLPAHGRAPRLPRLCGDGPLLVFVMVGFFACEMVLQFPLDNTDCICSNLPAIARG